MKFTINKHYITERNALIPEAKKFANERFGVKCPEETSKEIHAQQWSKCFHEKMNALARERLFADKHEGGK